MMKRLILISLLLLTGCVQAIWVQEEGLHTMTTLNFSVQIPQGWMKLNKEEYLFMTHDGTLLQTIFINRMAISSPLKYTKKKLEKGMLPQEVANIIIDNTTSNQAIQNYELKENIPATIGGQQGFKVTYGYKSSDEVKRKSIVCGFLYGEWFYEIRYEAPERYYFDKYLKTFEQFVESFRLVKG